ncbi:CNNM domain-containing protein, partial [Staphylococcus epidermidis]|uniref:CNNM domain-containing protein n=1 Tax=Staphylococcus epidermidis TaxID=1282 RepID=UPI0011A504DC
MFFLLIALTTVFLGSQFALVKLTSTRIQQLVHDPNKTSKIVKNIIHNLHYYLSPSQLPITLTSLPLPSLAQPTFQNMIHPLFHLLH